MKLRTHINPNYKTKKCVQYYQNGYCPYGSRCQFIHKESDTDDIVSNSEVLSNININNNNSNRLLLGNNNLNAEIGLTNNKSILSK